MNYASAKALHDKKRGEMRSLGSYIYMYSDYVDGQIVYVVNGGKHRPADTRDYRYFTIYPDDTIEFHWKETWGQQSFDNVIQKFTRYYLSRNAAKTKSHNYWLRGYGGVNTPMFRGLKVREGVALNPQVFKTRLINHTAAKPFKAKLSQWKKVLETTALLLKGEFHVDHKNCKEKYGIDYWNLRTGRFVWPAAENDICGVTAQMLLAWSHLRTNDSVYSFNGWVPSPTYLKNLVVKVTDQLRENWYSANDLFIWKEAA